MYQKLLRTVGILIAAALFASIGVGSVSAVGTAIYDGSVTVVNGSFAQTSVPVDYTNPGQYVYATTDAGVLNAVYAAAIGTADQFDYNLTPSSSGWTIADINGTSNSNQERWYVYINNNYSTNLSLRTVGNGDTVAFVYADAPEPTLADAIDSCQQYIRASVTVQSSPTVFYQGNVAPDTGTFNITITDWSGTPVTFSNVSNNSGLGVLIRGSGTNNSNYAYSLGAGSYQGSPYTWLNSINSYAPNWPATGYGYTIFKESTTGSLTATDSLEKFTLTAGESLVIRCSASSSGGVVPSGYTGTSVDDPYGTTYYPDAATHTLRLTLV